MQPNITEQPTAAPSSSVHKHKLNVSKEANGRWKVNERRPELKEKQEVEITGASALRIVIPGRTKNGKFNGVDKIVLAGTSLDLNLDDLYEDMKAELKQNGADELHHAFVIITLPDNVVVTGSELPEFFVRR